MSLPGIGEAPTRRSSRGADLSAPQGGRTAHAEYPVRWVQRSFDPRTQIDDQYWRQRSQKCRDRLQPASTAITVFLQRLFLTSQSVFPTNKVEN